MRRAAFVLGIVAAALATVQAQKQFQVYAGIVDGSGASPATIQPTDVSITENGMEAKILKVETVDRKVSVQLLVDNGVGLGADNIQFLRNGVRALFESLPANVEVALVTTAPQPRFVVRPTTDKAAMMKGVDLLSPDGGAGRFVESLAEATQRIERDKGDTAPIIIAAATTAGDTNVMDRDVQQVMKRVQTKPTTVHVILFSGGPGRSSGGAIQTELGIAVTKATGGRYETINSGSRIATLLPELGEQIAKSAAQQSRQFRITVERPEGASGDLGQISGRARTGLALVALSMDGRVR